LLKCVVAGLGEKISLASPYQRHGVEAGVTASIEADNGESEDVNIPINYSFKDLSLHNNKKDDLFYLKVIHIMLKPGDCVHIPAYWWYQVQTRTLKKPN